MKKLVMPIVALAAACLLAHGAWAAEIQWNSSHGGDMQVETNWRNNTKPTSSDTIKIAQNNDKPITLSEDLTATGGDSYLTANYELALTNSAGVAKTLSLKRIYLGGGSKTVRLTAGVLSFNNNLYMGDAASSYHDDTLIVDGATLSGWNSSILIGTKQPNNTLCVTNGATATGTNLYVGRGHNNETQISTNNCFRVAGAESTAIFSGSVYFGSAGLGRIEVQDGGCLTATNLYVRHNSSYTTTPWHGGNSVLVSGAGSRVVVNGASNKGFWLGNAYAPYCSVTVEDKATWESYGEFKIADGYTTNATFRVASGASLSHYVYSLNIGTSANAKNAALEIDNASVESVEKGISVTGDGSHVSISGANSRFAAATTTTFATGTRLEVEIPKDGFTGGEPPITCATLTFNAGSSLVVTLEKANNPGGRVVLARTTNNITTLGNLSVTLPDGVELDTSNAKELAVKIKSSGLVIVFR